MILIDFFVYLLFYGKSYLVVNKEHLQQNLWVLALGLLPQFLVLQGVPPAENEYKTH